MAPTLVTPPPPPAHLSPMETTLQLTPLPPFGPSIFTNTRALWHPPGARGIYGGAAIAQSLLAAYKTLPSNEYLIHSMHCYFVLAGDSDTPVVYYVERVRDGRGFATRTVQARQAGRAIFTATMSFSRRGSGGKKQVRHAVSLPQGAKGTCPAEMFEQLMTEEEMKEAETYGSPVAGRSPFETWRFPILNKSPSGTVLNQSEKRAPGWIRARGHISNNPTMPVPDTAENGEPLDEHVAHVCALAYMSDSYFIGTVPRVHNIIGATDRKTIEAAIKNMGDAGKHEQARTLETYLIELAESEAQEKERRSRDATAATATDNNNNADDRPSVGMMVTLDHTIFFHNPEHFRADDWLYSEMRSPWAGDGRGLVEQHIWARDGTLIATCMQEGVVRMKQDVASSPKTEEEKKKEKGISKL